MITDGITDFATKSSSLRAPGNRPHWMGRKTRRAASCRGEASVLILHVPLRGRAKQCGLASGFGLQEDKAHLRTDVGYTSTRLRRLVVPAAPFLPHRTFNHRRESLGLELASQGLVTF